MHGAALVALMVGLGLALAGAASAASGKRGDLEVAVAAGADASAGPGLVGTSLRRALQRVPIADIDYDGLITRAEAAAFFEQTFARLDGDRDGVLSEREILVEPGASGLAAAGMRGFGASRSPEFDGLDLDGDGAVSREEFIRAGYVRQASSSTPSPRDRRLMVFRALDGDGDGLVSRDRFLRFGARHFAAADQDGDGSVPIWAFLGRLGF